MLQKSKLQKTIDILLIAIIFLFPFTIKIAYISPADLGHPILSINLSISDFLIGITFIIWIIQIILTKGYKNIIFQPPVVLLFLFVCGLSIINAFSIGDWLKDIIQLIEYLFMFYLLLQNNLFGKNIQVRNILLVQTSLIVFLSFLQYSVLNGSPYLIRGLFENRNLLGGYLSIMLPIVFAEMLGTPSIYKRSWMILVMLLSVFIILTSSTFISLIISTMVISTMLSKKMVVKVSLSLLTVSILYTFLMPQKNIDSLSETVSFYEQGSISENYYRRLTILGDLDKDILLKKYIGDNFVVISSNLFMPSKMPKIREGDAYKDAEQKKHIKNFYLEMFASLNLIAEHTLTGVGLGNFQNEISSYYKGFEKINTSEPFVHCGYLTIGATTGILGLTAFIIMLLYFLKKSIDLFSLRNTERNESIFFTLGCIGSMIAVIIQNFFTPVLTSALLPLFIITLYNIDVQNQNIKNEN
jgi:hypothetical protein